MSETVLSFLRHGSPSPLPRRLPLRAGPVSLIYEDGDLRYLRSGPTEILRRIYAAVRDQHWNTIPGTLHDEHLEIRPDSFAIRYTRTHRDGPIHFVWNATLTGHPDGSIECTFDGEARSTFLRNRIGLCILHPIRECAGTRCRTHHADGSSHDLAFPTLVAREQPVPGLHDLTGLDHEIAPSLEAELRFSGDLFDTEDQRNWIDASFKTFCTPIRLPIPVEITAGTRIRQGIRFRLADTRNSIPPDANPPHSTAPNPTPTVELHPGSARIRHLPDIGIASASHGRPLGDVELDRLARLAPAHLRCDVRLSDDAWPAALRIAAREAASLGVPLELAVHFPDPLDDRLPTLLDTLVSTLGTARADIVRILVLADTEVSTTAEALELAQSHLADLAAPIGAGTDGDLYRLNLQHPPPGADFIAWSMNPQVHATDWTSLVETPDAAAQQVTSAATYFPGCPLVVSPITLTPRSSSSPERKPPRIDPRQASLAGAGWTLALLAALAPTAVESLTLFETSGAHGIVETPEGPPTPDLFPSIPGGVFPVYHLLADIGEFARGEVLRIRNSAPLSLAALALRQQRRVGVWLANLTPDPCPVRLSGLPGPWRLRQLDDSQAPAALQSPESWRRDPGTVIRSRGEELHLTLPPFAFVRLLGL